MIAFLDNNPVRLTPDQRALSRQESLSSLSVESLTSLEQEQALLEQCISSAMPKSKQSSTPTKSVEINVANVSVTKPIGVATKQFNIPKGQPKMYGERTRDYVENDSNEHVDKMANSKNVNATSAAGNTIIETNQVCPITPATVAGVESTEKSGKSLNISPSITGTRVNTSRDRCSPSEENLSTEVTKNGYKISIDKILKNNSDESKRFKFKFISDIK